VLNDNNEGHLCEIRVLKKKPYRPSLVFHYHKRHQVQSHEIHREMFFFQGQVVKMGMLIIRNVRESPGACGLEDYKRLGKGKKGYRTAREWYNKAEKTRRVKATRKGKSSLFGSVLNGRAKGCRPLKYVSRGSILLPVYTGMQKKKRTQVHTYKACTKEMRERRCKRLPGSGQDKCRTVLV